MNPNLPHAVGLPHHASGRPVKLNPDVTIPLIEKSTDRPWLVGFKARLASATAGDDAAARIIAALDRRLLQLNLGGSRPDMTFVERVHEAVRVYEQFLAHKHGRRQPASRTRKMIKEHGEKEAVARTVRNMKTSPGLELLHEHGRLDCAYEQIILDFPDVFDDPALTAKARSNLSNLEHSA